MLHGRLVRSPIASGRVLSIDCAEARALRGVKAVITADDVPLNAFGYGIKDEKIFVSRIRYCGEVLAAVAATDADTAEHAAKLVEIEYEETPGVFDVLDAIK